jgi:hypothetical protein
MVLRLGPSSIVTEHSRSLTPCLGSEAFLFES